MPDKNMKILAVDDFSTMRRIVRNILKQLGYSNIDEAENGEEAWQMLQKGEYDLVVSDWNMPVKTGIELLKDVRADENLKNLPFLLVTAEGEKSRVIEAIKSGCSNFILKPFTAKIMQEKLAAIFPE